MPSDVEPSASAVHVRLVGPPFAAKSFPRTPEPEGASIHTGRPTKAGKRAGVAARSVNPEKVLQAFNTWAFKREQPDDHLSMLRLIHGVIEAARPVPFVLYWGKGPRDAVAEPDIACLDFLAALARRVGDIYPPGAAVKLIFTDTHAGLNGHSREAMQTYFGDVATAARLRGFDTCWLGELVASAAAAGVADGAAEPVSEDTLRKLGVCAAKWFRGEGTAEEGAAKYLQMNMTEKRAVQHAFPSAIFITFNGSEYRALFPDRLPVFYMYSLKRGVAVKPWFLPAQPAARETEPA